MDRSLILAVKSETLSLISRVIFEGPSSRSMFTVAPAPPADVLSDQIQSRLYARVDVLYFVL
jgi:hypothetical protein